MAKQTKKATKKELKKKANNTKKRIMNFKRPNLLAILIGVAFVGTLFAVAIIFNNQYMALKSSDVLGTTGGGGQKPAVTNPKLTSKQSYNIPGIELKKWGIDVINTLQAEVMFQVKYPKSFYNDSKHYICTEQSTATSGRQFVPVISLPDRDTIKDYRNCHVRNDSTDKNTAWSPTQYDMSYDNGTLFRSRVYNFESFYQNWGTTAYYRVYVLNSNKTLRSVDSDEVKITTPKKPKQVNYWF